MLARLLSMIGSLQILHVENIQYISVSIELFKKKTRSYALKLFSLLSIWKLCRLLHDYYMLILSVIS